jgi:hypothetical protein
MFAVVTHYLIIVSGLTEGEAYGAADEPQADYGNAWFRHDFPFSVIASEAKQSPPREDQGLLRRGVHPEPVEGLLAMTESVEFSDTL